MDHKKLNRIVALSVFTITILTYWITLSPTVVFWDVGEFCAAAFSLQVPHPPGAPLFLLIARVSSMIPFVSDIAVRMHFISALSSALSIMFLYLISIKFILMWREKPATVIDKLTVYGSAAIGALSLTFTPTFWFNAVEAEVYGVSMLFVSVILWLALRWYERADWERSDVYLLVIAYLTGLSVGVHLLAILALFPVMLLFYFRRYEFSIQSFVRFGIVALLIFGAVYPLVVKEFPSMLDGQVGQLRGDFVIWIPILIILGAIIGVYQSAKTKHRVVNVSLLSFLFIVLGYSTYIMVFMRANAQTPMNENDPSTSGRLVSYLNREQYGQAPLMNRRYNDYDPEIQRNYSKYTSDFDYFWQYQLNKMYLRYFGWNFVGMDSEREPGVNFYQLFAIPLILGFIGLYHHWRRDPKMAFIATSAFLLFGAILVFYFNMQEPQPRERDYFYVGSFFLFSMWIGMGVLALIEMIKEKFGSTGKESIPTYLVLGLALLFVPVNMARTNFERADRRGNFVAWDYSYNLLQSCEQDAILFTNGDNDTFPLWYLQDVEGVRRDIRIVNLSLLNTDWYIKQLKHQQPYGAAKVPISISDANIAQLQGAIPYTPQTFKFPVPQDVKKIFSPEGTTTVLGSSGSDVVDTVTFFMPNTMEMRGVKLLRVQDVLVFDIVKSSEFRRPIYFAMTITQDGKIGLDEYLQLEGLAFRLVPKRGRAFVNEARVHDHLFKDVDQPSLTPQTGFRWRGLRDSTTYFDDDTRRLLSINYRQPFIALSQHYIYQVKDMKKASETMERMEQVMPRNVIKMEPNIKQVIAVNYKLAGNEEKYKEMLREIIAEVKPIVDKGVAEPFNQYYPNSYQMLVGSYEALDMYKEALAVLDRIQTVYMPVERNIEQVLAPERARLKGLMDQASVKDSSAKIQSAAPTKGK
ncbi:MAG: DUF2723 domain-containing protein [bacterium]